MGLNLHLELNLHLLLMDQLVKGKPGQLARAGSLPRYRNGSLTGDAPTSVDSNASFSGSRSRYGT